MKPTAGRIVHYVLPCCSEDLRFRSNAMGIHRPAIVVAAAADGLLVLAVLLDYHDARGEEDVLRVRSVTQDEKEKRAGTWHWPERDE